MEDKVVYEEYKIVNYKYRIIIVCGVLIILIFVFFMLVFLNKDIIKEYDNSILPSIYIDEYDMSNYDFNSAKELIKERENEILSRKVLVHVNGVEYDYSLRDLGLIVNEDETIKHIKDFQDNTTFSKKLWYANGHSSKQVFKFFFDVDEEANKAFFDNLISLCNRDRVDAYFDTSNGVKYIAGVDGFYLDYDRSYNELKRYFFGNYDEFKMELELFGDVDKSYTNDKYLSIDTMTSSFVTTFNSWITLRVQNLQTGVNYVNGAIVEAGEVFSFFNYAGPYNKDGYIFYYEYVGNGVCQVATTVYDSALLGGHEIVTRSPHKKKSEYVPGGLDATVASGDGWNTDMQFRNVYDYPIYIKAYIYGNEIHVEFWSNSEAKKGYDYSTESVWLGGRGYRTFRHTYKDGIELSRDEIATTWYRED